MTDPLDVEATERRYAEPSWGIYARTDVPALIAEVRRVRAALARSEQAHAADAEVCAEVRGRLRMDNARLRAALTGLVDGARHRFTCQRRGCARPVCDSCVCSCGLDAARATLLGEEGS